MEDPAVGRCCFREEQLILDIRVGVWDQSSSGLVNNVIFPGDSETRRVVVDCDSWGASGSTTRI